MQQKDDYMLRIEDYECLNNNSRLECKACNGFGKNSNEGVSGSTKKCYVSRMKMKEDLNLDKKFVM